MIETRESFQPLLKPGRSSRRKKQQTELASYGTLKGEALLHADDSNQIDGVSHGHDGVLSTPQSVEPGQFSEYMQPLSTIPVQQPSSSSNGVSPLSSVGLPPAIPLRHRADSSGDRSISEFSAVSRASGQRNSRLRRSSSDGFDVLGGNSFSPTYYANPPKPSRRSNSPKPPRSKSPTPNAGYPFMPNGASMNNYQQGNTQYNGNPLQQRRTSEEISNRHRRTHSYDVPRDPLRRGSSSASLYSLNSQGSMNSETLKLLPDPRWGGGSGGARSRSFSGGSHNNTAKIGSYSTDSGDRRVGYGSVGSVNNVSPKEVIMNGSINGSMNGTNAEPPRHRRTNSEISTSTFASGVSIDQSVEPVMTDMTKSALFKGVTNKGVVKLQLPKDNFRLLSDCDLESGCVYKRALVDNEDDYFQDYHTTINDTVESAFHPTSECKCTCTNCQRCHSRRKQLPPSYYIMSVSSDIYRRMFDEVSESMNMPCGLFYCGHHEDVDYPNIGIAVVGVVIIFAVMLWATIYVDG
mmetsp:Transcript_6545/g.14795  ORF Transcript_6545/g.14795 Transcript_6545/m.14795 type:complete len:520 (-) Transcript_6545:237-1796(-)|eukprot:CAMPEP_0172323102 /NCGR_PEP_ID=MMETSP1058-20130122/47848_1 /TAXON_ID=83371 /ORGANISM="Detonula confervacea, Strain CCMP 353" /LENGTH=519 /DNA_ID=CAMNT_0013039019 /DNA_START=48 /DNA_END=1607 /DNA_ORIENTATION=+